MTANRLIMSSQLLADAFARCDTEQPIQVLDFGRGTGATLNFLSGYRAKVFFADMLDESIDIGISEDASLIKTRELLARQLELPADVKFDVILFWDYLHQLDATGLEALSSILYPHLHPATRGYGFGALRPNQPLQPTRFAIIDSTHLELSPDPDSPPCAAHSQQHLHDHFFAMNVARATLLQEGRLELLFTLP